MIAIGLNHGEINSSAALFLDGTVDDPGRVQTVEEEDNGRLYGIIKEFEALTGVPVFLSTSFNINGEPIVLSPDDALTTFFNSGLLYLVMGDVLVEKDE